MTTDYIDRRVLVTGGAGFIGSHLVEELVTRQARVTVVDNLSSGRLNNLAAVKDRVELRQLDFARADLRPTLAEGGFDAIFHIGGNANVTGSVKDPRRDFENNALGTLNLLEAVRDAAPQARLVHTSSATVYGEGVSMPIREDEPTVPVSPYGISKLAAERYVAVFSTLYGLRTANVRLFSVYGPRLRKQVIYDLMCKLRENPYELFLHGDGAQVRDFNHVTNIVEALLTVAERARLEGEVYNVAADETVDIRTLAQMICDRMGAAPRFVYSGETRPGETQRWYADISRLRSLDYQPRIKLADGLSATVAWFRRETAAANDV
jgi:UDP-glucose 4-epimerase